MSLSTSQLPDCTRKFHAYCVGTPKSGTHSMAGLLSNYKSQHEPAKEKYINLALQFLSGSITINVLRNSLIDIDNDLCLEMNSSNLNEFFIDLFLLEFPEARYILTVRDCYSWMDSYINNQMYWQVPQYWKQVRDLRFRPDLYSHANQEKILEQHGLYTLDGYFSYWARHNEKILISVPSNKLLIVKTSEISESIKLIADFLGILAENIQVSRSHSFKAAHKYGLLKNIPQKYLEEKAELYCANLMKKYFPDIKDASAIYETKGSVNMHQEKSVSI